MKSPDWLPEHREWARKLLEAYGLESAIALIKTVKDRRKAGRKPKPEAAKFFDSLKFFEKVMKEAELMFPEYKEIVDLKTGRIVSPTPEQINAAILKVAGSYKPTLVPETAKRYFREGRAARTALFRHLVEARPSMTADQWNRRFLNIIVPNTK
jgi:hypothetical protein